MSEAYWILLLCLVTAVLLMWVRRLTLRLAVARGAGTRVQVGEERMFGFLQDLGEAIEGGRSQKKLHRVIVDGICEVVGAEGGVLYLLSDDKRHLVPAYLSEKCPPLVGVPMEVRRKAERDPRALESHLRGHVHQHGLPGD